MNRFLGIIFCIMMFASCRSGFSSAELALIWGGEGQIMPVMSIANEADSLLLRQKSAPMESQMVGSEALEKLCQRMLATVQDPENEGVGIAAPQVGLLRRMVAVQRFDKQGEPFEFYLNPEILELRGQMSLGGEGCLSVPDRRGEVLRSQDILIRYRDLDFKEHTERVEGFTAVIFQHEIDHLDGVLYIDRLEEE